MTPNVEKKDILELFVGLMSRDRYELYIWLQWLLTEKVECKECIELYARKGKTPDCYNNCIPSKNLINSRLKFKSGKKETTKNVIQVEKK